ncbi:MAG: 30S ribosomal protein S6 [Candidatus Poribacteria bacterium]|nr:30S ribosomal protein S6 [Candidatus Poribacteria bacterium]
MKAYELMLIITPDHEENEAEALTENVKGIIENGGNIIHTDVWGKRRLAYPIRKRSEGYYVVYVFESEPSFVAQLNQSLRVIEAILRHMIVLYEDDVEKLKLAQTEAVAPETSDADTAEDKPEAEEDSAESHAETEEPAEDTEESV